MSIQFCFINVKFNFELQMTSCNTTLYYQRSVLSIQNISSK